MKNITIAILAALVIVLGFLFFTQKKSPVANTPWPETTPAHTTTTTTTTTHTNPAPCTPSIVVTNPVTGLSYTTGQQVTITWTSCGVQSVNLGLVSGGKDFGELNTSPIPASQGSLQFTISNPAQQFTQAATNSYQIAIQSQSGDVNVRSGAFTVTTPQSTTADNKYNGQGFSFSHDAGIKITSGSIPNGSYVDMSLGNKFNGVKFFPGALPSNFNPSFFTGTTTINGKTFYFGSIQLDDGSIETSYMYKKNGKTLTIQNADLIDLGSVEIN